MTGAIGPGRGPRPIEHVDHASFGGSLSFVSDERRVRCGKSDAKTVTDLLHRRVFARTIRAASRDVISPAPTCDGGPVPEGGVDSQMKQQKASSDHDPRPALCRVNSYLQKNFPDFFAEARFQVGDDDYFLYARFGQYLARTIEQNRASRDKINRGFTVLNKMARVSARHPRILQMLVSGPLEYIVDAPKARALARKRLSPVAQGYLESLCE